MKNITITFREGDRSVGMCLGEDFLEFASKEHKGHIFERLVKQLREDRFKHSCHCCHTCHHSVCPHICCCHKDN